MMNMTFWLLAEATLVLHSSIAFETLPPMMTSPIVLSGLFLQLLFFNQIRQRLLSNN
jgi:hypothetical protein